MTQLSSGPLRAPNVPNQWEHYVFTRVPRKDSNHSEEELLKQCVLCLFSWSCNISLIYFVHIVYQFSMPQNGLSYWSFIPCWWWWSADSTDSGSWNWCTHSRGLSWLGNVTGYPGVFQGNPCPYPSQPEPVHEGSGFGMYGSWVGCNPRVQNPYKGSHLKKLIPLKNYLMYTSSNNSASREIFNVEVERLVKKIASHLCGLVNEWSTRPLLDWELYCTLLDLSEWDASTIRIFIPFQKRLTYRANTSCHLWR
jgi:hypothetical protein